ncbi:MAG TPA: aminopeptidase P family protein [Gemmatimonadaceae bacterium]|nr:aminopeptidase P family protein [Gemmatimonadaceae bacterium]
MTDRRSARAALLVDALTEHHLDALLVTGRANIRYITGFSGSSALLLVTARDSVLITDFRYQTQVRDEVGDLVRVRVEETSLWDGLWAELGQFPGRAVIGFGSAHVTHREFQRFLDDAAGARWQWRPQGDIVEGLRESKDEAEVALIQQAAGMATRALAKTLQQVRTGITELQIAGILEKALRDEGSEAHPFETIVASGPRSALPHARASRRVVERNDLLLLDFGAEYGGYCSDITRTVVVGHASDDVRAVYDIVRVANERAARAVHAGMIGSDADAVARDYISAAGFGGDFGHSLGHGIGLEVHEAPRLARTAAAKLPADTVVTIEPGIYRPEWGGVRIEDDVYLSADGPRMLTDFTHELLELSA